MHDYIMRSMKNVTMVALNWEGGVQKSRESFVTLDLG